MAQRGEREDIESIVRTIANRVVRGKHAEMNREVNLYRRMKLMTLVGTAVAAAFASAGVTNPISALFGGGSQGVQSALESLKGWPFVLLLLGLVVFVGLFVYLERLKSEDLEKKANLSLGLHEASKTLGEMFEGVLIREPEPVEQLGPVVESAIALSIYMSGVMPNGADCRQKIDDYANEMIESYRGKWSSDVPLRRRR